MTNQETVNFVFAHLRKQKYPSVITGASGRTCQYFDPASGRSCAVGCLKPKFFQTNPEVEGCSVRGAMSAREPVEKYHTLRDALSEFNLELLVDLQSIHDGCETTYTESYLEEAFHYHRLSEKHNVIFPQP
jgi:hypothetical protein